MEERSAAVLDAGGGDSDEEGRDDGYEVDRLLMGVPEEEVRLLPPVLQVTRRQKAMAGEKLLLPERCRKCVSCFMLDCVDTGEEKACFFCQDAGKRALCVRRGRCQAWSAAQYKKLEEARDVLHAIRETTDLSQVLTMGAGCANKEDRDKEAEEDEGQRVDIQVLRGKKGAIPKYQQCLFLGLEA